MYNKQGRYPYIVKIKGEGFYKELLVEANSVFDAKRRSKLILNEEIGEWESSVGEYEIIVTPYD